MNKDLVFKLSKGFVGRSRNCFKIARNRVQKALQYSYRDRKVKKRVNRQTFIVQIGNASRIHGVSYSSLMQGLVVNNIHLNRKILADLAVNEPYSFQALTEHVKSTTSPRSTESTRESILPSKLQHVPLDWDTFKKYVELHDQIKELEAMSNEEAQLDFMLQDSLKAAKEQNIKDLIDGKYTIPTPKHVLRRQQKSK